MLCGTCEVHAVMSWASFEVMFPSGLQQSTTELYELRKSHRFLDRTFLSSECRECEQVIYVYLRKYTEYELILIYVYF